MTSTDLQWIEFTDFSPGIHSNNHLAGGVEVTATNPAFANADGTYRCRSLPTGGLGPMPRMKEAFSMAEPPFAISNVLIHGFSTWGQVITTDLNSDHRIEVHTIQSLIIDFMGTPFNAANWLRDRIYDNVAATDTIYSTSFDDTIPLIAYQYGYLLKTRMNPASVTDPGELVMACIWNPPDQNPIFNQIHPDPADPDGSEGDYTADLASASGIYRKAVAHQGRIVLGRYQIYQRGVDTWISTNENIVWTDVNSNVLTSSTAAVFVPEIDQSISDWASMSANQLIVVKELGGGYVLQGDLDDVTVVRLPNLMSPDGSATVAGCQTPIGWVYSAGDRGLYVWNGGDQSEPLSPQLDGREFTANLETAGHAGQCDRWLDLLVTPNLWACDLDTRGWWRLDNPADFPSAIAFISTTKYRQQMMTCRQTYSAEDLDYCYLYEYGDLAYDYQWRSHPLWVSRDQYMEARQGVVSIQGPGTVTITLMGEDGDTDVHEIVSTTFDMRNYRFNTKLKCEALTVQIHSNGEGQGIFGSDVAAPTVHRLFIGYQLASHLPLTDSEVG